jgi:hypothetical protein
MQSIAKIQTRYVPNGIQYCYCYATYLKGSLSWSLTAFKYTDSEWNHYVAINMSTPIQLGTCPLAPAANFAVVDTAVCISYNIYGIVQLWGSHARLDRSKGMSVHVSTCTSYNFNTLASVVWKL